MSLHDEIFEQPQVLSSMFTDRVDFFQALSQQLAYPQGIFIAARGSSDNAARYAKYVWGAKNKIPVSLAAPSLFSVYQSPPCLTGKLVVGISQSGESPDIVEVLREANHQGCRTLAITNQPESPLASEADFLVDIMAGPELAVAATKSYTSQLGAIAMLSAAWSHDQQAFQQLVKIPDQITAMLEHAKLLKAYATRYRYMDQCVVLGRGYNYATAYEWSLKMKELAYVVSQPYSSADFQHGPIALVSSGFPIFTAAPSGLVFQEIADLILKLKKEHRVDLFLISDQQDLLKEADCPVPLPAGIPEWLSPIVTIAAAQLFSFYLTTVKGYDPDSPRGLQKVTLTI